MVSGKPQAVSWRLYVDIGNFAVKYGLRRQGEWAQTGVRQHFFAHAGNAAVSLRPEEEAAATVEAIVASAWQAQLASAQCEGIVVSCTAEGAEEFIAALGQALGAPVRLLGRDVQPDLPAAYYDPGEIGPDRLANAFAARALYGTPVIVLDCGTCLTSEVIDAQGVLIGGNITAGFPLISLGLMNVSERLREAMGTVLSAEPEHLLGRSTAEATNFGLLLQLSGTADRLVGEGLIALDLDYAQVVVTGGDGEVCSQFMMEDSVYDPLLTLEGLRLIDGTA